MASVNFMKCKGGTGEASAMIKHMERHDGKDVEYANRWVDKSRTHLNTVVGNVEENKGSRATKERLDARVKEIDSKLPPKRIRKDRVTIVSMEVPAPEGISPKNEEDFFRIAHEEIAKFCGGSENVSNGYVHRDEIHDYIDTDGLRKTSRAHMHMAVVPYVDGIGVNGKAFETRKRMKELNAAIDQRCRQELGLPFMTGKKGRTGRTVEELQAMSEGKAIEQAKQDLSSLESQIDVLDKLYKERIKYVNSLKGFDLVNDVKPKKTLSGKIRAYEVPAEVWETVKITRQDAEEVKKLRTSLMDPAFTQKMQAIAQQAQQAKELRERCLRLEDALEKVMGEYKKLKEKNDLIMSKIETFDKVVPGLLNVIKTAISSLDPEASKQKGRKQKPSR